VRDGGIFTVSVYVFDSRQAPAPNVSVLQSASTACEVHPAKCAMATGPLLGDKVNFLTQFHPVLRVGRRGSVWLRALPCNSCG
jgi:hypothetical protein